MPLHSPGHAKRAPLAAAPLRRPAIPLKSLGAAISLSAYLSACAGPTEAPGPAPVWQDLGVVPDARRVTGIVAQGDVIVLATDVGLRRRAASSEPWLPVGAPMKIDVLRVRPGAGGILLAGGDPGETGGPPFLRSDDGGRTWVSYGEGLFSAADQRYVNIADLAVQPAAAGEEPVIFANTSGGSIARSLDGGSSWNYVAGSAAMYGNYDCVIHVPTFDPNTLYQGCEAPLDDAWVDAVPLPAQRDATPGTPSRVVGLSVLGNRRPNRITDDGEAVLVGVEGGLMRLTSSGYAWLWRADNSQSAQRYTYVAAIWVDPHVSGHVVFGGWQEGVRRGLWEIAGEGSVAKLLSGPDGRGGADVAVDAVASAPDGRLLAAIEMPDGVHLFRR